MLRLKGFLYPPKILLPFNLFIIIGVTMDIKIECLKDVKDMMDDHKYILVLSNLSLNEITEIHKRLYPLTYTCEIKE